MSGRNGVKRSTLTPPGICEGRVVAVRRLIAYAKKLFEFKVSRTS
jgi:hypothetical protein